MNCQSLQIVHVLFSGLENEDSKLSSGPQQKKNEIDSQQLNTTGLFYSSIWFYQVELCVTILQSQQKNSGSRAERAALPSARKLNIEVRNAENINSF